MIAPVWGRSGKRTRLFVGVLLGAAVAWALAVSPAFAAETTMTPVQELQQGPLIAITCTDCHASLVTSSTTTGINFSHGYHMTYACTACHPRFPHFAGVTEKPGMKLCFNCHGLRHGPQGIVAPSTCSTCHLKPRSELMPADHTGDWATTGHDAAGATQFATRCAMCHTKAQCDACHLSKNVSWETTQSLVYDSGTGCLACHSSELPRLSAPVTASGLDASAHRNVECRSCHPDFRYDDKPAATKVWQTNAGLACQSCHAKEAAQWKTSVHAQPILSGNDPSGGATCAGCHGGHNIALVNTQAATQALHLAGQKMCVGACHQHDDAYASYGDWWHGAAYKQGTIDAPACWDCHNAHNVVAMNDPKSPTSAANLPKTCGQCHLGSDESFAQTGVGLIHGRVPDALTNPLAVWRSHIIP